MRLHEDSAIFKEAVTVTAQRMGITPMYVEKDYWVTWALQRIFASEAATYAVFKGGTALSKCFKEIERFSEDIDLVVLNNGASGNQLKKQLKTISSAVEAMLPEVEIASVTNKKGMIRKTAHTYAKQFDGPFGQVRDFIVLESTWLGYHEPHSQRQISSFIFEMMVANGQQTLAEEYNLLPFNVRVLDPTRTLCEKIMSLVRFSHTANPIEDLRLKVRHIYDIHQLLTLEEIATFFDSPAFESMLIKVAQDDVEGYKSGNAWLSIHPKEAILFRAATKTWEQLKSAYEGNFANLVYGELPDSDSIVVTLHRINARLQLFSWSIDTDNPAK